MSAIKAPAFAEARLHNSHYNRQHHFLSLNNLNEMPARGSCRMDTKWYLWHRFTMDVEFQKVVKSSALIFTMLYNIWLVQPYSESERSHTAYATTPLWHIHEYLQLSRQEFTQWLDLAAILLQSVSAETLNCTLPWQCLMTEEVIRNCLDSRTRWK